MQKAVSQGGCLCGSLRYQITGAPRSSSVCFCRSCRLASGSLSVAWFVVDIDQYELLSGQVATFQSSSSVVRSFCATCGTPLAYQHEADRDTIELTTATLDDVEQFPATREIWHKQKVSWAASDSAVPHFLEESQREPEADIQ